MGIKYFYNFCVTALDSSDLDGDILSAVRKSYFDNFDKIRDRITTSSDGEPLSYDYDIEKDKLMKWTVKNSEGVITEKVEPFENGRYHICFFSSDTMYKRLLFSKLHTLLKVEYFDEKGVTVCSVEPRKVNGQVRLLYSSVELSEPILLNEAPSFSDPRVESLLYERFTDSTVIASTNDGVIKYLTDSQLEICKAIAEDIGKELSVEDDETFVGDEAPLFDKINVKDFNVKRNLASALDISEAGEFDFEPAEEKSDTVEKTPVNAEDSEEISLGSDIIETITELLSSDEEPSEPVESVDESEGIKPDKLIMADGAVYSYFGGLDPNGNRSGVGRTLTELGRTAYEGEYVNDKRSGKGAYFYKDGTLCYSGEWSENVRHGIGVGVSSRDGSIHAGNWVNNKPEGDGVRVGADGVVKFVCKKLEDGSTVLMNYLPDETVLISKYDKKGGKIAEKTISLTDFS